MRILDPGTMSRSNLFFFNDTATTEIYTLSLHDALPICRGRRRRSSRPALGGRSRDRGGTATSPSRVTEETYRSVMGTWPDRKSTRLNSSHGYISYAVFCLKKKKNRQ